MKGVKRFQKGYIQSEEHTRKSAESRTKNKTYRSTTILDEQAVRNIFKDFDKELEKARRNDSNTNP